ncbi:MAG: enoyl-[acyl-carrier protein] reductase [Chloroflexota bacterium]|nr:enoyl-[acyl-carrier protein] reductase [Chloroflexota bacterium]
MQAVYDFSGKVALVTGSGRGIGRVIAHQLAEYGADLVINYVHNQEPAEEIAADIRAMGRDALVVRANIGKMDGLGHLFDEITEHYGRLDILVANAASGFNRPALQQKESGWDHTLNVNARSFLFAAQRAVPLMQTAGQGRMVAITSPGAEHVMPDYIAVGASKAALNSLVRYLAVELAPQHISVNAVSPGIVETDALTHFAFMQDDQVIPRAIAATPAGRLVTSQDIANAVCFLCSPQADMIRGQVLVVDGGYTLPVPG